jgi:hypothetical protein
MHLSRGRLLPAERRSWNLMFHTENPPGMSSANRKLLKNRLG